ncbi:small basic family protein [Gracilibacillus sp. YIM 98692]|uniref:small basic family protein n=1 Tax=Gracilibacillus sp. YIM 98692 TaxID=2663532 RepID=UPI0013D76D93|nr:small basic family protein [Gracilibacillus sp. YIM 98692]
MGIPIIFLILGLIFGLLTNITIPEAYTNYLAVIILAALDALIGGIRAQLERQFQNKLFISGFFFNVMVALVIVFIGEMAGVELYLAAVIALGIRMLQNISNIRKISIQKGGLFKKSKKNKGFSTNHIE